MTNKKTITVEDFNRLCKDLEYDLTVHIDVADASYAYKYGLLKSRIQDAKDTIRIFREVKGIDEPSEANSFKRISETETTDDFDGHPLTVL